MPRDFTNAIRTCLRTPCTTDVLGPWLKPAQPKGSRLAWKRICRLAKKAAAGELPSARILGKEFGVSSKTIYRDLDILPEMGFQLQFDPVRNVYRCEEVA